MIRITNNLTIDTSDTVIHCKDMTKTTGGILLGDGNFPPSWWDPFPRRSL